MVGHGSWNAAELPLESRRLLRVAVPGSSGAVRPELPFQVVVGKVRKPRVLLIAGVHGDEYESVAALHDLATEINARAVSGTVVIVPVANPSAFHSGMRRSPVDLTDLNRSFPGNPQGSFTERLADVIFRNFVIGAEAVLSMHCWSREATVIPYVEYPAGKTPVAKKSAALARILGAEFLHPYTWHPGLLVAAAVAHGIPAVESEVGGQGTVTPAGQRSYRSIAYRFLQATRVLVPTAEQTGTSSQPAKVITHADYRANQAGLFRSRVSPGEEVEKGSLLGAIYGLAGECVEEVRAPGGGIVGIMRTFAAVQPGDLLFQLFRPLRRA